MTTIHQPIVKLYKRCKWGHHTSCDGRFLANDGNPWSICTCDCHSPQAETPAAEAEAAITEAEAIIASIETESPITSTVLDNPQRTALLAQLPQLVRNEKLSTARRLAGANRKWKYAKYADQEWTHATYIATAEVEQLSTLKLQHDDNCAPSCHCQFTKLAQRLKQEAAVLHAMTIDEMKKETRAAIRGETYPAAVES